MTNFKAIIIADAHIGADKFEASPDRWDAPIRQAFEYAVEVKADVVISCGDFFHKRNPTVAENIRRRELLVPLRRMDIPFFEADGNHDRSNAEGSHSAISVSHPGPLYSGAISQIMLDGKVNMIGLPWPRPVDYLNDEAMKEGIDKKIELTRGILMTLMKGFVAEAGDKPVILFGHAMLAYGPNHTDPKDPGLILGKDVVLPYQAFIDAGLTENQIFMGHVHDPSSLGYVGSTQPTDWSDAEHDKSFVELDISECATGTGGHERHLHENKENQCSNGWTYAVTRHSYTDQIRLHDIVLNPGFPYEPLKETPVDVARVTINLAPGETADEAALRKAIADAPNYARLDRVIINHPKREATRVDTETPMADMDPGESFELWMKQAGYSADEAAAPYKEFESLIESSK